MTTAEDQARRAAEGDVASRLLDRLATQIGGHASVKAIFGEPVERDGVTVVPVARVRWGVGGGGGEGPDGAGSGGGGGISAEPVGYIEISSAGASFRPLGPSIGPAHVVAVAVGGAIILRALARFRR